MELNSFIYYTTFHGGDLINGIDQSHSEEFLLTVLTVSAKCLQFWVHIWLCEFNILQKVFHSFRVWLRKSAIFIAKNIIFSKFVSVTEDTVKASFFKKEMIGYVTTEKIEYMSLKWWWYCY